MGDNSETSKCVALERSSNQFKSCKHTPVFDPGFLDDKDADQTCSNKTKSDHGGWRRPIMGRCRFVWSQKSIFSLCWKEASKYSKSTACASIPKDDVLTHEQNFNANAVRKSRSEESNDVCGGVFVDHVLSPSGYSHDGEDQNFVRLRSIEDHSHLKVKEKKKDRLNVIESNGANLNKFRQTLWSYPGHWLRGKLNIPSLDLLFPGSFMGMHKYTYVLFATLFVLWTKLGIARTFFQHLVDTLVQVLLLTLLMTTTAVIFEANDLTAKIVKIGKNFISFLTSLTSGIDLELQHHVAESRMSDSDHRNNCGIGGILQSNDVCQGKKIACLEGKHPRQDDAYASCQEMCSQSKKAGGEIEPVQFSERGTVTEDALSCYSDLIQTDMQTMTESFFHHEEIGTQTDVGHDADGEELVFYCTKDEEIFSEEVWNLDAEVQTELDLKKIYEETEKSRRSHARSIRGLQRKFLAIRRCCQKKVGEMKCFDMHRGSYLAKLQLQLPVLQQEKNSLVAERALIEKQFADEKKKNRDLVNRMTKLNQQFSRLSQGYSTTTTPAMCRQPLKSSSSNFCRLANDQQQYTQQNTYNVLGQNTTKIPTQQIMLPQSLYNTGSGHGRQMNGIQQQTNKMVQTLPQHSNVVQQPRLPIFQLLQNSILSNAGSDTSPLQLPCPQQLSISKKHSSLTNHQSANAALLQNDKNVTANDCSTQNMTSSEATKKS